MAGAVNNSAEATVKMDENGQNQTNIAPQGGNNLDSLVRDTNLKFIFVGGK